MKKNLYSFLLFCFLLSANLFCLDNVQNGIQNLNHNLTTTTQAIQEVISTQTIENATQSQIDPNQITIESLDLADIEQLEAENGGGLDLTLGEKLALGWVLIKGKTKEHFEKNGKWYLIGIVGAAGAISAYYYFNK
jgi:hypothetical protein